MQFRQSFRCSGVEPRFFARNLARNLLLAPSWLRLLAVADSPAPTAVRVPPLPVRPPSSATASATHTTVAVQPPVPWPNPRVGTLADAPPRAVSLQNSTFDSSASSSHSPFTVLWDFILCLNLGGHSMRFRCPEMSHVVVPLHQN